MKEGRWKILAGVMDALVAPSFCAPGFEARQHTWPAHELDVDLSGKTVIITGANSGIGYVTAQELANRGATVVMACRNLERAQRARQELLNKSPESKLVVELVDMGDLESVSAFVNRLREYGLIDVLVHNAGLLVDQKTFTPQGLETTFAVHVLGPFLLTQLLNARECFADEARVIFVSSGGMYTQRLKLETLLTGGDRFDGTVAYAQAKRAQVILSRLWAERLGPKVSVNAMHPGWADTPGVLKSLPKFHDLTKRWLRTPEQGADTVVWLAASPAASNASGKFYFDRLVRSEHLPGLRTVSTKDDERRLWDLCETTANRWTRKPLVASSNW